MNTKPIFVPQLFISSGVTDISFYKNAFGAVEFRRLDNPDGTVHIAELLINGVLFHLHEENPENGSFCPDKIGSTTTLIGIMVDNPNRLVEHAVAAGATILSPVTDYDYGYRQGEIKDPFGHRWLIEKPISEETAINFKHDEQ